MKSIFAFFIAIAAFLPAQSQYRNLEIKAAGLTCSLCSNAIQKALKSLPFVQGISTELKSNTFKVELRPGVPVNLDMISKKVEDAGFSVGTLTVDVKFNPAEIKNDAHLEANGQIFHFMNVKAQKLTGWQTVRLLDPNFVLSAEAKKNAKLTQMPCYKTGITADCCGMGNMPKGKRIYHVTI